MTFEEAAAIVGMAPFTVKPGNAKRLASAIADFQNDAEYRMEASEDADALETLGRAIGAAIKAAQLESRSNTHMTETRGGLVGYTAAPDEETMIDALCDYMGPGNDIVRYAALMALEAK